MDIKTIESIIPRPNCKGFYVYKGESLEGKLLYIGTTTQRPADRFRWHKANNKDFVFSVIKICNDADDMLDFEFMLIKAFRPPKNKIMHRRQNLNVKLSEEQLEARRGNPEWCQVCLKRRARGRHSTCKYCG